jgi:TM2 domain-containing membrane protein YozV
MVAERNVLLAYILWFFLGNLGVHRFYTGRAGTGVVQILLSVVGWATVWVLIGWVFLAVLWLWLIVDIFLIPGMCRTPR